MPTAQATQDLTEDIRGLFDTKLDISQIKARDGLFDKKRTCKA